MPFHATELHHTLNSMHAKRKKLKKQTYFITMSSEQFLWLILFTIIYNLIIYYVRINSQIVISRTKHMQMSSHLFIVLSSSPERAHCLRDERVVRRIRHCGMKEPLPVRTEYGGIHWLTGYNVLSVVGPFDVSADSINSFRTLRNVFPPSEPMNTNYIQRTICGLPQEGNTNDYKLDFVFGIN